MILHTDQTDGSTLYKLLSGLIIPRPIGWISTISDDDINNLAPFSFFNAVSEDPPHVMFSMVRPNHQNKDSLNNILSNKQFVVNFFSEHLVKQMNMTSESVPSNVDEFMLAGLTPISSEIVKPMRVQEAQAHFECECVHHYFTEGHQNGGACVIIGKVLVMHIDEEILLDNYKINLEKYRPVARLAGSNYSKMGEFFSITRK